MSTISENLQNLSAHIEDAYTAISNKGVDVTGITHNATNLSSQIDLIECGSENVISPFIIEDGIIKRTPLSDINFDGVSSIESKGLYQAFRENTNIHTVTFNDLTYVKDYGLNYAFYKIPNLSSVSFPKLTSVSANALYYTFSDCSSLTSISFPEVKYVKDNSFYGTFNNCSNLKGLVHFNKLESVNGTCTFQQTFAKSKIEELTFDSLKTISGNQTFYQTCLSCSNLKKVSFPSLTSINSLYSIQNFTQGCDNLEVFDFPVLSSLGGYFNKSLDSATKLTEQTFPELKIIIGSATSANSIAATFGTCTYLQKLNLPKLKSISGKYLFTSAPVLSEIHFGAENQAAIEATAGYSVKFGAPSTCEIYFDL